MHDAASESVEHVFTSVKQLCVCKLGRPRLQVAQTDRQQVRVAEQAAAALQRDACRAVLHAECIS